MKTLPIDVEKKANGLLWFRWRCRVDTPVGVRVQDCEGGLPLSAERAVADLIALCKQQETVIEQLREELRSVTPKKGA